MFIRMFFPFFVFAIIFFIRGNEEDEDAFLSEVRGERLLVAIQSHDCAWVDTLLTKPTNLYISPHSRALNIAAVYGSIAVLRRLLEKDSLIDGYRNGESSQILRC